MLKRIYNSVIALGCFVVLVGNVFAMNLESSMRIFDCIRHNFNTLTSHDPRTREVTIVAVARQLGVSADDLSAILEGTTMRMNNLRQQNYTVSDDPARPWLGRNEEVNREINLLYNLLEQLGSEWVANGSRTEEDAIKCLKKHGIVVNPQNLETANVGGNGYKFFGSNLTRLVLQIATQAQTEGRTEIYLADLGSDRGGWSVFMERFVSSAPDFPNEITVHIFNITGERRPDAPKSDNNRVIIHNIDLCKIEEIYNDKRVEKNKFDLVVSRNCLRHLADPAGTIAQIFYSLQIGGYFFGDLFYVMEYLSRRRVVNFDAPVNMVRFFEILGVPAVIGPMHNFREVNFFMKRPPVQQLDLLINYGKKVEKIHQVNEKTEISNCVVFHNMSPFSQTAIDQRKNSLFINFGFAPQDIPADIFEYMNKMDGAWGKAVLPRVLPNFLQPIKLNNDIVSCMKELDRMIDNLAELCNQIYSLEGVISSDDLNKVKAKLREISENKMFYRVKSLITAEEAKLNAELKSVKKEKNRAKREASMKAINEKMRKLEEIKKEFTRIVNDGELFIEYIRSILGISSFLDPNESPF